MQCQVLIGQHNYMGYLHYNYRGTCRDVLRAQPPLDDIEDGLIVKLECLGKDGPSMNGREFRILKPAVGDGFPGLMVMWSRRIGTA